MPKAGDILVVLTYAMVAVVAALGFDRFAVCGHDRGGRVAHRMALDHEDRVTRLAVLDIAPTREMYRADITTMEVNADDV